MARDVPARSRAYRIGSGSRTPILWIHGLGESGACFEAIAAHPRLAGRRHRLPDLPGYGDSPPASPPKTLAGVADGLAAWLEAERSAPVVAVGHSQGGVLALLLAERHPARLRALVDVEGNKSEGDCGYSAPIAALSLDVFRERGRTELCALAASRAGDDPAQAGYSKRLGKADPSTLHAHATELLALSREERLAERLGRLALPRLFVSGVPRGCPPRSLELVDAAGVPRREIGPAGHWPFVDRPDDFADVLAEQLATWRL